MTTNPIHVTSGTIVIYSDLTCPFAHVIVQRLRTARTRLGLDEDVAFDHHAFPIELLNRAPGTRHGSDSEIPVLGPLDPDAGWQLGQGPDYHYPSIVLPAFVAAAAAKRQSLHASEQLDRALRRAFWADSRPIHLHHEILHSASQIDSVDTDRLDHDLRHGIAGADVFPVVDADDPHIVSMSPTAHPSDCDLTSGTRLRRCAGDRVPVRAVVNCVNGAVGS